MKSEKKTTDGKAAVARLADARLLAEIEALARRLGERNGAVIMAACQEARDRMNGKDF